MTDASTRHLRPVSGPLVRVLEADPDLAAAVPAADREAAVARLVAGERWLPEGPWESADTPPQPGTLGLLVIDGIVAASTEVHGRHHTELLGPGDLLQPWIQTGEGPVLVSSMQWRVQSPLTALVLDRRFALAAAPWPEIVGALMNRLVLRARRLSFQMAVSSLPRASERLLLMLWHFAERWGKVTPDGVMLRLPITHSAFASVVGTRRPSLTTAIGELRDSGRLETRGRGDWILCPPAPTTFAELREQVGLPSVAPSS